jgi:hypothetical protein
MLQGGPWGTGGPTSYLRVRYRIHLPKRVPAPPKYLNVNLKAMTHTEALDGGGSVLRRGGLTTPSRLQMKHVPMLSPTLMHHQPGVHLDAYTLAPSLDPTPDTSTSCLGPDCVRARSCEITPEGRRAVGPACGPWAGRMGGTEGEWRVR